MATDILRALLDTAEDDASTHWSRTERLLGDLVGCDSAHLVPFDSRFAAFAPDYLRTFADRPDLSGPILRAIRRARSAGAYVDTELLSSRERDALPFYAEIIRPAAIRSQLVHLVRFCGRTIGVLHCNRIGSTGTPFEADALTRLTEPLRLVGMTLAARSVIDAARARPARLTAREREVAELAAHGFGNLQIAAQLERSPNTVRNQLQLVFKKLGVHSRVDLANVLFSRATESLDARAAGARAAAATLDEH